jgi:protein phosphatase
MYMTEGNQGIEQASSQDQDVLLPLTYAAASDVGRVRTENQDAFASVRSEVYEVFVVADGMGGVEGGAIASQLAIKKFIESLKGEISKESLIGAIQEANIAVFERGQEDERLAGMGTTFVALCFSGNSAFLMHVGDSRAYRLRGESLEQLTKDHTLVQELVDSGALNPHQVENHPVSHMLTRSLGPSPRVLPECQSIHTGLRKGDRFLLCSDGLYNHVQSDEIAQIIGGIEDEVAVQELISLANARGGSDNITVLIVSIEADIRVEQPLDSKLNSERNSQKPSHIMADAQPTSKQITTRNALILTSLATIAAFLSYLFSVAFTKKEAILSRQLHSTEQEIVSNTERSAQSSYAPPVQRTLVGEQIVDSTVDMAAASEGLVLETVLPSLPVPEEEQEARNREKREELLFHLGLFEKSRQSEVADLLTHNGTRQIEMNSEFDRCQARLDIANRKLAVWYERKKLLKDRTPLSIAIEIAAISGAVGALKEQFDEVTWEYLRKVEALRYEPENRGIEEQMLILRKKREQYLQKLIDEIRETVQEESLTAEKEVAELSIEKDLIASKLAELKRTENILRVITQGTVLEQKSLQMRLKEELHRMNNEDVLLQGNESVVPSQISAQE